MPTHYQRLGVPPEASQAEIRAAYRRAARKAHPDAGGTPTAMQHLNAAWHELSNPARRAAYDRSLRGNGPAASTVARPTPARTGDPPDYDDDLVDRYTDLLDDRPIGPIRTPEGWWALAPPAALVLGCAFGLGGVVLGSPALFVFAAATLFVAMGLFVLVPLRAMTRPPTKNPKG